MTDAKPELKPCPGLMRKPGPKRHGLLALISDAMANGLYFCPSSYSPNSLHGYGLTVWDTGSITMAERAGLIEQPKRGLYRLTATGTAMLEKFPFETFCEIGRPCQQCVRSTRDSIDG